MAMLLIAPLGEISLSAATARTVLQIQAPAQQKVKVVELALFGKGTSGGDTPIYGRCLVQTTAGTMSSLTLVKNYGGDDETPQTTASHSATGTEPTASDVKRPFYFHPQSGLILPFPPEREIIIKGGTRLGIELTAAQAQTITGWVLLEE